MVGAVLNTLQQEVPQNIGLLKQNDNISMYNMMILLDM